MKISTRQLALCAVLTALALGLSTLENLFPVTLVIPLPGVKLGLANIVTVFALYQLGPLPALCILAARCLLGSLFAGNASALLFSLLGGTLAMLVMLALSRLPGLSVYGVSIGGGPQHRPDGGGPNYPGQHRRAGISAVSAGGVPVHRGPDGLRVGPAAAGHQPCEVIRLKESG